MAQEVAKKDASSQQLVDTGDFEEFAGLGSQNIESQDMSVPFMMIAQALSPAANKREPGKYIEGLVAGDFYNRSANKIHKEADGWDFIPVLYERQYLEWVPRDEGGGGFRGAHKAAILDQCTADDKGRQMLPNGNEIVTTGVFYGFDIDKATGTYDMCVCSLAKTAFKAGKDLNTFINNYRLPRKDGNGSYNPPMFFHIAHVSSVPLHNDQGHWSGWKFEVNDTIAKYPWVREIMVRAKEMHDAIQSNVLKAKFEEMDQGSEGPSTHPEARRSRVTDDEDIPF